MDVDVVANDRNQTGESPVWSVREGAIYWLDTRAPAIYRVHLASGKRDEWACPAKVNAVGLMRGGLVCSSKEGIYYFSTATGALRSRSQSSAGSFSGVAWQFRAGRRYVQRARDLHDECIGARRMVERCRNKDIDRGNRGMAIPPEREPGLAAESS